MIDFKTLDKKQQLVNNIINNYDRYFTWMDNCNDVKKNRMLWKSAGLNLKQIIEQEVIFRYGKKLSQKELDKLNKEIDIFDKHTNLSKKIIVHRIINNLYGNITKLEDIVFIKINGKWHQVNKLNTNSSDLSEFLLELLIRMANDDDDYQLAYDVYNDLKNGYILYDNNNNKIGFFKLKDNLRSLIIKHFIINGNGLNDFLKFINNSTKHTKLGEEAEKRGKEFLINDGFSILFEGGNGNCIDIALGVDFVVKKDNRVYKIQVKSFKKNDSYIRGYGINNDWYMVCNDSGNIFIYDTFNTRLIRSIYKKENILT
jgi:hypothetical protein